MSKANPPDASPPPASPATPDAVSATPLHRLYEQLRVLAGPPDENTLHTLLAPLEAAFRSGAPPLDGAATASLQRALAALASWMALATQRGAGLLATEATARAAVGRAPRSWRDTYGLLIECGDRAWLDIAGREEFARALGAVINEGARARLGQPRAGTDQESPTAPLEAPPALTGIESLYVDPAGFSRELEATREKLDRAVQTLATLGDTGPGVTPREAVWSDDLATLYRMGTRNAPTHGTPVLLVYALVNREHVLDLEHGRSLVEQLLGLGLDVWLLGWHPPTGYRPPVNLERYVDDTIRGALDAIGTRCRRRRVDVIGVCQGGTLSLCHAARHPRRIRRLVTLVTPVDFHVEDFLLARWLRHVDVDLLVDALGNVPGAWLNALFLALRPLQLGSQKYLDALERLQDPREAASFLRMERWLHDSPDQAGEAFRDYARDLVRDNGLVAGSLRIGGTATRLRDVRCPVLNIVAARDHIVPPAASLAMRDLIGTRHYRDRTIDTGHIGLFTSRRHCAGVAATIAGFLSAPTAEAAIASVE